VQLCASEEKGVWVGLGERHAFGMFEGDWGGVVEEKKEDFGAEFGREVKEGEWHRLKLIYRNRTLGSMDTEKVDLMLY